MASLSKVRFGEFAAERLVQSSWTQNPNCKAFQGLSTGIKLIEKRPVLLHLFALFRRSGQGKFAETAGIKGKSRDAVKRSQRTGNSCGETAEE